MWKAGSKPLKPVADAYLSKAPDWRVMQAHIEALLEARGRSQIKVTEEVATARVQTLGQVVVTLIHHNRNSAAAIDLTAQAVDPNSPEDVAQLQKVCRKQTKKIDAVLKGLHSMAEEKALRTTPYMHEDTMFDIADIVDPDDLA
ncbi:MAG: hypothetical protein QGH20_07635 [Candidatus Latescibacteria bacterium]|nr:hypothetical protein [Candidatus Latescibacterota bacterium]